MYLTQSRARVGSLRSTMAFCAILVSIAGASAANWDHPAPAAATAPAPAPAAVPPPPTGPLPENAEAQRSALRKACSDLDNAFQKMETIQIPGGKDLGITGTLERHETLMRLVTESWALKCDMSRIIAIEVTRVDQEEKRYAEMAANGARR